MQYRIQRTLMSTYINSRQSKFVDQGIVNITQVCVRIILNISSHLKPLYDVSTKEFIPTITGVTNYSKHVRKLISLPTRLGSKGILFVLFGNSR